MHKNQLTVKQAASLSGVSVRTLHHYHKIGLLEPAQITEAGYRLYGPEELARLQQILLYKELGFPLDEIRPLLGAGRDFLQDALAKQTQLLMLKRKRLDKLIELTQKLMQGEDNMDFSAFDTKEIDTQMEQYAQEVKDRWGETLAYEEYQRRTASYGKKDWEKIYGGMGEIFQRFAACMPAGPASPQAQALVTQWRDFISTNFYPCTDEILQSLGQMYEADPRFQATFEKTAPGLGKFIAEAIQASSH